MVPIGDWKGVRFLSGVRMGTDAIHAEKHPTLSVYMPIRFLIPEDVPRTLVAKTYAVAKDPKKPTRELTMMKWQNQLALKANQDPILSPPPTV